uniref:Putative secreted peptide n=1 Tax=Anopheles braziliensis TaxID=58242 RepID=A0A2M3ZU56_9DIPT
MCPGISNGLCLLIMQHMIIMLNAAVFDSSFAPNQGAFILGRALNGAISTLHFSYPLWNVNALGSAMITGKLTNRRQDDASS